MTSVPFFGFAVHPNMILALLHWFHSSSFTHTKSKHNNKWNHRRYTSSVNFFSLTRSVLVTVAASGFDESSNQNYLNPTISPLKFLLDPRSSWKCIKVHSNKWVTDGCLTINGQPLVSKNVNPSLKSGNDFESMAREKPVCFYISQRWSGLKYGLVVSGSNLNQFHLG